MRRRTGTIPEGIGAVRGETNAGAEENDASTEENDADAGKTYLSGF